MFGMLSGSNCNHTWRRVYAGLCRHQHRTFGVRSVMFLSYEAMFLYLLGVDAGRLPKPPENAPGCCKLRTKFPEGAWLDERAATFCAAFGLVLARVKLEDDVRDDYSWLARSLLLLYRKPFRAANRWFDEEVPGLSAELSDFLQAHMELEQVAEQVSKMGEYVRPTASAFGAVYAAFAECIGADEAAFRGFGADVGAMIISADCAIDWQRDRAKGQFNPLPDRAAVKGSFLYSLQRLSQGLWRCEEALPGTAALAVLHHVFSKIRRQQNAFFLAASPVLAGSARDSKAGFCDCDCGISACLDPSCCGDCGCSVCDACDCGGDPCCRAYASSPCQGPHCLDLTPCDCGDKQQTQNEKPAQTKLDEEWIGLEGITRTPLSPYGVVEVAGQELSARSEMEHLLAGTPITVVDLTSAGVVVRRSE